MVDEHKKIVIPGGSGFLGRLLSRWFADRGWEVVSLSRRPGRTVAGREVAWDGRTTGAWVRELDGAQAVVNLAGRSVNCRYHARNRRAILDSRIDSTRALGAALASCRRPPAVWLNSSTATIYRHSFDRPMDELTGEFGAVPEAKDAFSVEVAQAWEQVFCLARAPATRKVALRTAMVLAPVPGTVFDILTRLARWGLGGAMGDGRQYMSWIHEVDFCRAVEWLIVHDELAGAVNIAAPQPLPNREVMALVRDAVGARCGLPVTRWMLEVGAALLRTETELVIKSRRVVPARLTAAGFTFRFPTLQSALQALARRTR